MVQTYNDALLRQRPRDGGAGANEAGGHARVAPWETCTPEIGKHLGEGCGTKGGLRENQRADMTDRYQIGGPEQKPSTALDLRLMSVCITSLKIFTYPSLGRHAERRGYRILFALTYALRPPLLLNAGAACLPERRGCSA